MGTWCLCVRTKDLTECTTHQKCLQWLQHLLDCHRHCLLRHTLSLEKKEFGEEARHLYRLQNPMNIYCQINHFCQVSAGYDMPVPWNLSSTGSLENALPHHCTFECNDLFLIQHLFSTSHFRCFLKCLQKLYPARNPAISEVAATPMNPVLLLLPGRRPGRRGAEVLSAGLQVRLLRKRSRGNREMGLGCISWLWLRCQALFQHFLLGRIRLLHLPNCSQWRRMCVGETPFVLNSVSPHYTGSWADQA